MQGDGGGVSYCCEEVWEFVAGVVHVCLYFYLYIAFFGRGGGCKTGGLQGVVNGIFGVVK